MIEVPERVKDALREGIYRKEYRIIVPEIQVETWTDITDYEETIISGKINHVYSLSVGTYRFTATDYVTVMYIDGGSQTMVLITPDHPEEITFDPGRSVRVVMPNAESDCFVQKQGYEDLVIDNNTLVKESVHIDERVCSGDRLKFGLCEGTSLEFQYFNHPNLKGMQIQLFIDIQYKDSDGTLKWHTIPMGFFDVDECSMQFSTGIRQATAYNKLKSDYLDARANDMVEAIPSDCLDPNYISLFAIQNSLLNGYKIIPKTGIKYHYGSTGTTGTYYEEDFSFKCIGDSHTYHPYIETQLITFWTLDPQRGTEISRIEDYIEKLRDVLMSLYYSMLSNTVTAAGVWASFLESRCYYIDSSMNVVFGDGNVVNGWYSVFKTNSSPRILDGLKYLTGVGHISLRFPISFGGWRETSGGNYEYSSWEWTTGQRIQTDIIDVMQYDITSVESLTIPHTGLPDVTLREFQSSSYEISCQYGKLDRETDLFSGIELNGSRLLPADDLYPDDAQLPYGVAEGSFKSQYKKLWFDEGGIQKFRYLIVTYKGTEEDPESHQIQEVEKTLQRTVNTDGTVDYNMSDNWLFRNLVWTDEQVGEYADAMVLKMKNITWFPFEMWAAGLPYLEAGDEIEINAHDQTYTSYILNRQLRGIQNLEDTFVNGQLDIF